MDFKLKTLLDKDIYLYIMYISLPTKLTILFLSLYQCNVEGIVAFSSCMETAVDSLSHPGAIG